MGAGSSFGRVLTEHRKARGMSRSQLAEAAGLSYPYVSQLETGLRKPSRESARKLAAALAIDPIDLEGAIPASEDEREISRANTVSRQLLTGLGNAPLMDAMSLVTAPMRAPSGATKPDSREDLIGQMVDLLEELEPDQRLDALAEVQKRAMERMIEQRSTHRA
jgi:transcriptional regulator with XRE-family HTH domain